MFSKPKRDFIVFAFMVSQTLNFLLLNYVL